MKETKNILISVSIETDSEWIDIDGALRRGVYAFLDTKGIARPNLVKVNYIEDVDEQFHT